MFGVSFSIEVCSVKLRHVQWENGEQEEEEETEGIGIKLTDKEGQTNVVNSELMGFFFA